MKYEGSLEDHLKRVFELLERRPVFLQVASRSREGIVMQAKKMYDLFRDFGNPHIKVPIDTRRESEEDYSGYEAIMSLAKEGIPILATAIVTPHQAFLAARAGAKYSVLMLRPFDDHVASTLQMNELGREGFLGSGEVADKLREGKKKLNDYLSAQETLRITGEIFSLNGLETKLMVAGIRSPIQVSDVLRTNGVSVMTLPYTVLSSMFPHPSTSKFVDNTYGAAEEVYAGFLENVN